MGFYTKNNYLHLPNKKVVDDLLDRHSKPDEESFTPYNGMNHLIGEQMIGDKFSNIGIDIIKDNIAEIMISKVKAKKTDDTELGDLEATDDVEYFLEDIEESYVRKHLIEQLVGIKINKTGARQSIEAVNKVQNSMYDTETGEVFNPSDVKIEDEFEESYTELRRVKDKIPYLLKKLQDGSIEYGVSLLSLFIARDGVITKMRKREEDIKPRDILDYPIYRVSSSGDLVDTFDKENANNIEKFRVPKDLVLGVNKNDKYYRAGVELTNIARQLNYNLYEEDVRDYKPSYIDRLMSNYIMSNQEVLTDMSSYDPNIMRLFKDGSIFKVPTMTEPNVESNKASSKIIRLMNMGELKSSLIPSLHERILDNEDKFTVLNEPVNLINEFFKLYKEVNKRSNMEESCTEDCNLHNETLCDYNLRPKIFKGDAFLNGFGDTPLFNSVYFIITGEGYIVKLDEDPSNMIFTTVVDAIRFFKTKNRDLFFKGEIRL